ncbi:MAG: ATP-binding protein [Alphaproteobacteria bacterium]|nr:ATP-binding protein [Polyangiaceae bacterium]MCB9764779.1 ATP-binding protein [Alphaproteobacteria bacterium]
MGWNTDERSAYPFCSSGPVADMRFLGRETLLKEVLTSLVCPPVRRSTILLGRRRQGKTSLLLRVASVMDRLQAVAQDEPAPDARDTILSSLVGATLALPGVVEALRAVPLIPAYVDLAADSTPAELARRVATRCGRRLSNRHALFHAVRGAADPISTLLERLEELREDHDFTLVLLVDEGARLAQREGANPSPEAIQLTHALRRLAHHRDLTVRMLLASTAALRRHNHDRLMEITDSSPTLSLGNLRPAALQAALETTALSPEMQRDIVRDSGGNPFFFQCLGVAATTRLNTESQIVDGVRSDLKHLSAAQRTLLSALSTEPGGLNPAAPETALQTEELRQLLELDYVTRNPDDRLCLREPLLAEVLGAKARESTRSPPGTETKRAQLSLLTQPRSAKTFRLEWSGRGAEELGTQRGLLWYLLLRVRRDEGPTAMLGNAVFCYALYLGLAILGEGTGVPPTLPSRVSAVRSQFCKTFKVTDQPILNQKSNGDEGGYYLAPWIVAGQLEAPLPPWPSGQGQPLPLLAWGRRFEFRRRAFMERMREMTSPDSGLTLVVCLRRAAEGLFRAPRQLRAVFYDLCLTLRIERDSDAHPVSVLPPIPLTEEHGWQLRYWMDLMLKGLEVEPGYDGYRSYLQDHGQDIPASATPERSLWSVLRRLGLESEPPWIGADTPFSGSLLRAAWLAPEFIDDAMHQGEESAFTVDDLRESFA